MDRKNSVVWPSFLPPIPHRENDFVSANLDHMKTLRRKFLLALYEMTDANTNRSVQADAIGAALRLDEEETESVVQWLIDRGCARWFSMGGYIAITAVGVDQAEAFLTEDLPPAAGESSAAQAAASDAAQQPDEPQYDLFVSHASEDKDFARTLYEELHRRGLRVWFDELQLKVGDSLREKIDHGLARSRFGVVIFSPAYFSKGWAMAELNAFLHRQVSSRRVVILPIRLNVSAQQVADQVPLLADRYSLDASEGVTRIAEDLEDRVKAGTSSPTAVDQAPSVSRRLDKAIVQNLALPQSFAPPLKSDERALAARAVLAGSIPATPEPVLGDGEVQLLLDAVEASRLERLMVALTSNGRHVLPEQHWRPILPRSARLVTLARPAAPVRIYSEFSAQAQAAVTLRPVVGQDAGGWLALALDVIVCPPATAEEISGTPLSLDDLHALVYRPITAIFDEVGPALLAALNDGQVEILGLGYALIPNQGGLDDYVKLRSSASRRIDGAPDPSAIHWQASTLHEVKTPERRLETTRQLVREFFIDGGYSGFEPAIERLSDRMG